MVTDINVSANTIAENSSTDAEVEGISLGALDENGNVLSPEWSFTSNPGSTFAIAPASGAISLAAMELDYETTPS